MRIFVVLGHLMNADGSLKKESKARVDGLIKQLKGLKNKMVFFCGWAYRKDTKITIAEALKNYFISECNDKHNLVLSEKSRDTVSDAIFLRELINLNDNVNEIIIFTSDYHCKRVREIFKFVYGPNYRIKVMGSRTKYSKEKNDNEKQSLETFYMTFRNIQIADLEAIKKTMLTKHQFFNGEVYNYSLND